MSESLFTSQVPTSATDASDGAPGITTATTLKFAVAGTISAVRFYATSTVGGTYNAYVWEVTQLDSLGPTGTLVGSQTLGTTPTGGTWNNITLSTPVIVDPTKLYRIGLFNSSRYVATNGFFVTPLTNGNITAYANSTGSIPGYTGTLAQGTFRITASVPAYPDSVGASASYFVDVLFDASGGGGGAAPNGIGVPAALGTPAVALGRTAAPAGLSVPVALGSPSAGNPISPSGLAAPVGLGSPSTSGTVVSSTPVSAGWHGLLAIGQENYSYQREERMRPPVACPNDGEPLRTGPDGELYCPWDGWQWQGPRV